MVSCIMNSSWQSIALPGVVALNQPLCQLKPETLEDLLSGGATCSWLEVLQQDESIDCTAVKEEPEDVSVMERKKDND